MRGVTVARTCGENGVIQKAVGPREAVLALLHHHEQAVGRDGLEGAPDGHVAGVRNLGELAQRVGEDGNAMLLALHLHGAHLVVQAGGDQAGADHITLLGPPAAAQPLSVPEIGGGLQHQSPEDGPERARTPVQTGKIHHEVDRSSRDVTWRSPQELSPRG
jgi:hypothetical protein